MLKKQAKKEGAYIFHKFFSLLINELNRATLLLYDNYNCYLIVHFIRR